MILLATLHQETQQLLEQFRNSLVVFSENPADLSQLQAQKNPRDNS